MNDATPPRPIRQTADRWQRLRDDVVSGARTVAPPLVRAGQRFGDWLAAVGWGKFLLVALLVFVFVGIFNEALVNKQPAFVIDRGAAERVNVQVSVGTDGIRIAPSDSRTGRPARPPAPPSAPSPSAAVPSPSAPAPSSLPGKSPATVRVDGTPTVRIDDGGVRIVAESDGRKVQLIVDGSGVRVRDVPPEGGDLPAPPEARREGNSVVLPPELATDPDRLAEALAQARDTVEEIIQEQVDRQIERQIERQQRAIREQSSDWLMSLAVLLILGAVIFKVVLGSKRKAESRAQQATATAAEEGLKRQLAEAQLKMMQAQVEPHFLFNTLASVDYLIETDPPRASTMQKNLIQYLRAALPQMREGSTTLGKELALCRSYLEILKVRMDERLQFAINVPAGLGTARFPPMMLQSLVENAIKHGLEPKPEGGSLTIGASIAHGMLSVTVADTGLGFGAASQPGTGVGLANVRERLAALYGPQARLAIEAGVSGGTIATIEVPYAIEDTPARPTPAVEPSVA